MPKTELTNMIMIMDRENNKVLVQNRKKHPQGITFPGGHVEKGESFVESALREVKEETGLTVKNLKSCGVIHWCNKDTDDRYLAFLYKTSEFKGNLKSSSEEGDVFWVDIEKLETMELSDNFQECLPVFFVENYSEGFSAWNQNGEDSMKYK
ncbi:MAG: 8-oxo-dGTP diphosphatase [Proteocatella sp.]